MLKTKLFDDMAITIPAQARGKENYTYILHIIGYDSKFLDERFKEYDGNPYLVLRKIFNTTKARGDATYSENLLDDIISECWRVHIHVEYDRPTYGTFDFTDKED